MTERGAPLVLVVDDNPATRYATARVLRAADYQVREAGTGQEALALADADVAGVVLDVHLPDLNGFEVCRLLRERADTARVPVIHLSAAYVGDIDKVKGLHSGADAYMTHPAEPALLTATLQALIRARTAEEGMRRSEARFRAIYGQVPSGIALLDSAGRFADCNSALLAMLRTEAASVTGRPVTDFLPSAWRDAWAEALVQARDGVWRGEFPLRAADGTEVPVSWTLSMHAEPGLMLATATDVSERVELSRQREALLEREQAARGAAERLNRAKDEFIAVLSHELRTPLNAIVSWVHVLKRPGATPAILERGLESIERNAHIQTRLVSDILDMSRMDLGKLRLDIEGVDPAVLVRTAVATLGGAAAEKGVTVEVDVEAAGAPLQADESRLQQIVWNLLTNAIKFSPAGGVVRVRGAREDGAFVLTVEDAGIGIAPDFLAFMFDRFTQGDSGSNRQHGGLGLGLSIVKHLAELHGGTVAAHSEGLGRGARFTVTLPEGLVADRPRRGAGQADAAIADAATLAGVSVLVVDDDAEAREMLTMILSEQGARVSSAASAAEGLATIAADPAPDVLVSDIGMPGDDGYSFIRAVRAREEDGRPRLPAVALTAFARPQDRDTALASGFDAHCGKPLRPHLLIAAIAGVLNRR